MPENIAVRPFRASDARDLVRLHRESEDSFEEADVSEEFMRGIASREDFRFLVATEEGKVIGFVGFLFHTSVRRAEIGPICVDKAAREHGVGKKLLDQAVDFLREAGIKRVIVKVKAGNKDAISFFSNSGFVEEGFFQAYTAAGEDALQLRRFI